MYVGHGYPYFLSVSIEWRTTVCSEGGRARVLRYIGYLLMRGGGGVRARWACRGGRAAAPRPPPIAVASVTCARPPRPTSGGGRGVVAAGRATPRPPSTGAGPTAPERGRARPSDRLGVRRPPQSVPRGAPCSVTPPYRQCDDRPVPCDVGPALLLCAVRCGGGRRDDLLLAPLSAEGDAAVSGGRHGLRRVVDVPTSDPRRRSRSQHQPGVHALLVRTGGSLCPVQTESEQSSSRARACQSLIYLLISQTLYTTRTRHFTTTPLRDTQILRSYI